MPNRSHPTELATFRRRVEAGLAGALRRLAAMAAGPGDPVRPLVAELRTCLRGGKRSRPMLFFLAYTGYGGRRAGAVWPAAAAIELLHAFALIHDDVLDGTARRRGRPTLPVRLRRFVPRGKGVALGRDLAMLAGDVTFALAVDTFLTQTGPPARLRRALRLIMNAAMRTGGGVVREIVARSRRAPLSEAALAQLYDAKTGIYSFVCPLQAGAMLAGAPEIEMRRLAAFGRLLGRAYQIRDDLDDVAVLQEFGVAAPGADELSLLYPVQLALRVRPRAVRAALRRSASPLGRAQLAALLCRTGVIDIAARRSGAALRRAWQAANRLGLPAAGRERLLSYCRALLSPPSS